MKRLIKASLHNKQESLPSLLADKTVQFILNSTNSTYNDDILEVAEQHGALKVKYTTANPSTGSLFGGGSTYRFVAQSESIAEDIFDECKRLHIPLHQRQITCYPVDWYNAYNIVIDDYETGCRTLDWHNTMKQSIASSTSADTFRFSSYLDTESPLFERLQMCASRKSDILELVRARFNYLLDSGYLDQMTTKEIALDYVADHIAANNQDSLVDWILGNYNKLLNRI